MSKKPLFSVDLAKSDADNIIPEAIAKPDGNIPSDDWLRALVPGTYFVAKPKQRPADYLLHEFIVLAHTAKTTWLASVSTQQKIRVESLGFSNNHRLIEVIAIIDQEQANDDGQQRSGADQSNRLADPDPPA